ncbi:MAG: hypothetical protein Q9169_004982 [Polycauliona sp. 2 TL-2023]
MSRRVFDVGLDVDRIKNGLKIHSSNRRNRNQRSASISGSPPTDLSNGDQLAVVPRLKGKKSNPALPSGRPEHAQPLSPDPVALPSVSSPLTHDFPQPPAHSPTVNGHRFSTEDHMEPLHTPIDDSNNFDLKPPPPNKPVKFLEHYSEQLFSDGHLRFILGDPAFFLRFTAFLNRYKPHSAPILIRYLEAQKAVKAVEYANALAESFKPIPGDASSQIPCVAAMLDSRFESRSKRAMDTLVNGALPGYITQAFTKVVTETMVREITGTTVPIMRELVGGLAEVFCLSDPSIKDNPIVYASEEFYRTTQYGRDYVIGRNCRFLQGPKTDRNTVARIKEAVRTGQESFETILNYRRDGSPFMNLVMTAPLYDNKGVVRYFIGAQVDISGLVEEGRGLDSFERYLAESRRNRNSDQSSYNNQKHMKILSEFSQMLSPDESSVFTGQGHSREGSLHESEHGNSRATRQGRRDPNTRQRRRVLGNEDEDEQDKERNAWALTWLGPSGKLPGVYQNYLLLRPHPSLRIIFVSPALRIPGLLQAPFLSRIGGPPHVRSGLLSAFENGEGITAKITWLPSGRVDTEGGESSLANTRPGSSGSRQHTSTTFNNAYQGNSEGKTRYISCTPLLGSDDRIGVWMIVMVEKEPVTGSLASRTDALSRYGHGTSTSSYSHGAPEIPPTPSEYEREPSGFNVDINNSSAKNSDERVRSPAPEWRGNGAGVNGVAMTPTPTHTQSGGGSGSGNVGQGAKRFHGSLKRDEGDPGRMYADFMRYQRGSGGGGKGGGNGSVNGNVGGAMGVVTPPAGMGRVLGSDEADSEVHEEGGLLDGVGDGGR